MLPGDDQLQKLINVVGPLKFAVELPTTPDEYFSTSGATSSVHDEQRRYMRSHLRVTAGLQYRRSLPSLSRDAAWYKVVMRDISRGGISFLHSEQLFPTEQLMLVMPDCKPRCIEVTRCRRINDTCYEVGANFIKGFRSNSATVEEPVSTT